MSETTHVDLAVTAILDNAHPGHTPRIYLRTETADIAPYVRMDTVDIHEPDTWPAHNTGVDLAAGEMPKYRGLVVLAIPAPGLDADRVAVAIEFPGPDMMEALADLLLRMAAKRREMHDPDEVREAYPTDEHGNRIDVYERSLVNAQATV